MAGSDARDKISAVKSLINDGEHTAAYETLCDLVSANTSYPLQQRVARLFQSLDISKLQLQHIKIAILATSTVDHMLPILRYWLSRRGFDAELWLAPYDTLPAMCLDKNSALYEQNADIIWLFTNWRDVELHQKLGASVEDVSSSVRQATIRMLDIAMAAQRYSNAQVVINNADVPADEVFGNMEASVPWSRRNLLRQYNLALGQGLPPGILVIDFDYLSAFFGKRNWYDARYWFHSKNAQTLDALGLISSNFAAIIAACRGLSKKCLVLDLDNTIWGGAIGDEGIEGIALGNGAEGEAYLEIQRYAKSLKERGIILAVCSKNEEALAREPFETHPDMLLSLEDISVFAANWDNKAKNIANIAEVLNIGLDSIVFVDDSPVERDLVRNMLPMISVPELPEDPAEYVKVLQDNRYFEATSFSDEDRNRADLYKSNAKRNVHQTYFEDLSAFLADLEMSATVGNVDTFYLPRAAQLINKSNQFQLTGNRYTETELKKLISEPSTFVRYFKLKDRFGDNGLISVLVLKKTGDSISIDTWVMSCRVLGRQMEEFIISELISLARQSGATRLLGTYVPSKKNALVRQLYQRMGFALVRENNCRTDWCLDLDGKTLFETHIKKLETDQRVS